MVAWEGARRRSDVSDVCVVLRVEEPTVSGPGSAPLGVVVLVVVCVGFLSASGLFGDFWAGPGVAPRGGAVLDNGVRWRRRWPGGQARRVVWRAGLLGCCGCRRCRCADACGVVRGCVRAGLGFG